MISFCLHSFNYLTLLDSKLDLGGSALEKDCRFDRSSVARPVLTISFAYRKGFRGEKNTPSEGSDPWCVKLEFEESCLTTMEGGQHV